jgi:hypothetical protein
MGVSKGSKVVLFYNGFIRIYAPRVGRPDTVSETGGPP